MTETESALLILGIQIGMLVMLFAQIIGGVIDDRRDRKVARAAQAQLDAACAAAAGGKVSGKDLAAARSTVPDGAVLTAEALRTARGQE